MSWPENGILGLWEFQFRYRFQLFLKVFKSTSALHNGSTFKGKVDKLY